MHVQDLVDRKGGAAALITVNPDAHLAAAVRLLVTHHIGALPVVDAGGALVGFLDERDVVRATHERFYSFERLRARDVMHSAPTCDAGDTVEEAMLSMTLQRRRHLLVTSDGVLRGVISLGDLVKARLEQLEAEAGVLRDYVAAHRASR
jgi:CBS domain-containing protein